VTTAHGPWKAFVFDFDGTLARQNIDFGVMRSEVHALMSRFDIPSQPFSHLHVLEMIDAATLCLSECRPREASIFFDTARAKVTQMEIAAAEGGALFDHTRGLLGELQSRFIRTGIITRNCRRAVLKVFPDIDRYCQVLLTRNDISRVKPHPGHLSTALKLLDVDPTEAVMVGDHPMDIQLGREVGTYTIGVLTGHSSGELLRQAKAEAVIANISDIIDIIS
jgi:phosphoglycolate phosphatase